ncbi:hypothetical protein DIDNDMLP_00231 [Klebsiella phage KP13-7]|nr:hypothetical protein DIDNDMLP_00231 [Klebsiella phage KP13-7]
MVWKTLKENDLYEIDEYGNIRNKSTMLIRKTSLNENGYKQIILSYKGKISTYKIHRLVANNFLAPPTKEQLEWAKTTKYKVVQVNHKDGNKLNNHKDNLEWNTNSENMIHSFKNLNRFRPGKGSSNINSKLTKENEKFILTNYKKRDKKYGLEALARQFNVSATTIARCINNNKK